MNNNYFTPIAALIFSVLAGCSSVPPHNPLLDEARNNFNNAQARPEVTQLAPLELKQASESLDKATEAWNKREDTDRVNHLAHVTKQQVAIAEETAKQKAAEQAVATSSTERDRVRLDARTREADLAQQSAKMSQRDAEEAKRLAEASQRDSAMSQRDAEEAKRLAEASQKDSVMSKQEAEEAKRLAQASQRDSQEAKHAAETAQREAAAEKLAATEAELKAQAALQQTQEAEDRARKLESEMKDIEMQLQAMEAKKTDRGMVITLGDVVFDTNKAHLKSGGTRNVQKLADFLKQHPERKVLIEGFTDSKGSEEHNQQLSDKRAEAVRTALINMGVEAGRVSAIGYGESFPIADNGNSGGRQMNRRVEVVVSDATGNISPRPGT